MPSSLFIVFVWLLTDWSSESHAGMIHGKDVLVLFGVFFLRPKKFMHNGEVAHREAGMPSCL